MNAKKLGLAAGALACAGAIVTGAAMANASTPTASLPRVGATASASPSADATGGPTGGATRGTGPGAGAQRQTPQHTDVTGDEAAKVSAAVTAKDSAVTVTKVMKDADGSYDVVGTKAGAPVRYEVSADLKTVSEGRAGGPGGRGGHAHTEVTGDEAAKVSAAVTAKDSAVTVTKVMKDPDGSYDVHGTKAGANVMFDVSADLQTVTQAQGGPGGEGPGGGKGGRHGQGGQPGSGSTGGTASPTGGASQG